MRNAPLWTKKCRFWKCFQFCVGTSLLDNKADNNANKADINAVAKGQTVVVHVNRGHSAIIATPF